jgi:hypothetical protein
MIMPIVDEIPGVQSASETCTGMGSKGELGSKMGIAWEEEMVASRKNHHPTAN